MGGQLIDDSEHARRYYEELNAPKKTYLGDGAYVEFDGECILLTTSDGLDITNRVYLDADTWQALKRWAEESNL